MAVAAHEGDAEEIEEPTHVPLGAVARATVLARTMIDRQLGDSEAAVGGEDGNESVELSVQAHAVEHLRPVCLQAAVHVVQMHTRDSRPSSS